MRTTLLALLLTGCLDPRPALTCAEQVCSYVPACSPLTSGDWTMISEEACLDTFTCGADEDACRDALLALPCLSDPPTDAELDANTRAMKRAREACRP